MRAGFVVYILKCVSMTASYLAGRCNITLFERRTRTIIFNFRLTKRNRKNSESDQAREIVRDR